MLDICKMITCACDAVMETFWPTRCVGCDLPGDLLCPDCAASLPLIDPASACPRCGAPYAQFACTECPAPGATDKEGQLLDPPFVFDNARAACSYEGTALKMLRAYKDGGELRLAPLIARHIAQAVQGIGAEGTRQAEDWGLWAQAVVAVPPNAAHVRKRGYEHLQPIAAEVARLLELPLLDCLSAERAFDQRLLSSRQRAANRAGSIRCTCDDLPERILLVDDVLTTGSTANAAAAALLAGGAHNVRTTVFARVW